MSVSDLGGGLAVAIFGVRCVGLVVARAILKLYGHRCGHHVYFGVRAHAAFEVVPESLEEIVFCVSSQARLGAPSSGFVVVSNNDKVSGWRAELERTGSTGRRT